MELDSRKFRILEAIIDDYILTAMPVGSRTLSRKEGMGLSSATIRNEMSDLEALGYLDQPHSSAGRVPSWKAYRLYVDHIMQVAKLDARDQARIQALFSRRMEQLEDVISSTAQALSELTDYTGMVLAPQRAKARIRRVQLVPVTETSVLMVMVNDVGSYTEAMLAIPSGIEPDHLFMLSNYMTEHMQGLRVDELSQSVKAMGNEMRDHRELFSALISALESRAASERPKLVVLGTSKFLNQPEYSDIEKARTVLNALETRDQLAELMAQRARMDFTISIGPELSVDGVDDLSLVTLAYRIGGQTGSMGVIGPTRMQYGRVMGVMGALRGAIGSMIENQDESEDHKGGGKKEEGL